jgi:hypothetical protein
MEGTTDQTSPTSPTNHIINEKKKYKLTLEDITRKKALYIYSDGKFSADYIASVVGCAKTTAFKYIT